MTNSIHNSKVDRGHDAIKEICFYSDNDIKMFRFEQVMEENPEEEEEEEEKESSMVFDEITVEDEYFEELNDSRENLIYDA